MKTTFSLLGAGLAIALAVTVGASELQLDYERLSAVEHEERWLIRAYFPQPPDGEVSVEFAAEAGSATPGEDFELSAGILHFDATHVERFIEILLLDDFDAEGPETFELHLTFVEDDTKQVHKFTILDDEEPVVLGEAPIRDLALGRSLETFAVQSDGRPLVGFCTGSINRLPYLFRFDPGGTRDTTFTPAFGYIELQSLIVQPDDRILCLDSRVEPARFRRLLPNGAADLDYHPEPLHLRPYTENVLALQPDGRLLVYEEFLYESPGDPSQWVNRIIRLHTNGLRDDSFMEVWTSGTVSALAVQADGRILVGEIFWEINGLPASKLARVNSDGSLDTTFGRESTFDGDGAIQAICVLPDQRLLVAGSFEWCSGVRRPGLVRLHPDGTIDPSFDAKCGTPGSIYGVQTDGSGRLLIHGEGCMVQDFDGEGVIRLEADGTLDPSLRLTFSGPVHALVQVGAGTAYAAGDFRSVSGVQCPFVARIQLNPAGRVGCRFQEAGLEVDEGAGHVTLELRRQGNVEGTLAVAWTTVDGSARAGQDYEARSGTLEFGPGVHTQTLSVPILDNGTVEEPRAFEVKLSSQAPGYVSSWPARVVIRDNETDVSVDDTFAPGLKGLVKAVEALPDGRLVLAGQMRPYADDTTVQVMRVLPDGSLDTAFQSLMPEEDPRDIALDSQGRILVCGGWHSGWDGGWVARFKPDGTLDTTFEMYYTTLTPYTLIRVEALADGRVLVLDQDGQLQQFLPNGSLDDRFAHVTTDTWPVNDMELLADGRILVANRIRVGRLLPNGREDPSFRTLTHNGCVAGIHGLPDGRILVAGWFTEWEGHRTQGIARLLEDGTVDRSFSQPYEVYSIWAGWVFSRGFHDAAVEADGHIVVVGDFRWIGPRERHYIARLEADGAVAEGPGRHEIGGGGGWRDHFWDPDLHEVQVLNDGAYVTLGSFDGVNGLYPPGIVRFHPPAVNRVLQFETDSLVVGEDAGTLTVDVRRIGDVSTATSVRVVPGVGTATLGADYLFTPVTLQFNPLQVECQTTLSLIDDGLLEGEEQFDLQLVNLTGGGVMATPSLQMLLLDDELPGTPLTGWHGPFSPEACHTQSAVEHLWRQPDGKVLLAVSLPVWTDMSYRKLVRVHPDGTLDSTFTESADVESVLTLLPDGRWLARSTSGALVCLEPDGEVEGVFAQDIRLDGVISARTLEDGRILVAGWDSGEPQDAGPRGLMRLLRDGSIDASFHPSFGPGYVQVEQVAPLVDGRILIRGSFQTVNGMPRPGLARLLADGSLDESFEPGVVPGRLPIGPGYVLAMLPLPDGGVLLVGDFEVASGDNSASGVLRLHSDGQLDAGFNHGNGARTTQGTPVPVRCAADLPGHRILICGNFGHFDGHLSPGVARLNPDGSVDTTFRTPSPPTLPPYGPFGGGWVNTALPLPDGDILVGGRFTSWITPHANLIMRISGDPVTWFIGPRIIDDGVVRFGLQVKTGHTYVLECSEDLRHWRAVSTNTAAAPELWFDDQEAPTNQRRFFRTLEK